MAAFSYPVGQAPATQTNDNAAAGKVGEFISANLAQGSAISLTTGTAVNVTSISLTPGDWDVEGEVDFTTAVSTSVTSVVSAISSVSGTLPTPPNNTAPLGGGGMNFNRFPAVVPGTSTFGWCNPTGTVRVTLSATTTIYLIAFANFTVSTMTAYGFIGARRVR